MTNLRIFLALLVWIKYIDGRYYDQIKVFKFDDYLSSIKTNESKDDHIDTETYFEAIKETFDLYYRDNKYSKGKICKSNQTLNDIGDLYKSYEKLKANFNKNCSYVIGNLVIAHIHDEDISFLNSIEEISGFLFIFSNSIESIELKKLKVIRGENPWISKERQKFGMVIANNFVDGKSLKYLLLPSLQVILRYNVLFHANSELCYAPKKIYWDAMLGASQTVIILEKNNKSCLIENGVDEQNCHPSCQKYSGKQYCWSNSSSNCQKINNCVSRSCPDGDKCYRDEIKKSEECCHEQCAGGCTGPSKKQCLACKNLYNDGDCVEFCPRPEIHDGIRYIRNPHGKLTFNHICVDRCPVKFVEEFGNCVSNCTAPTTYAVNQTCVPCPNRICPKICRAKDVIENKEATFLNRKMLDRLENCTVYDGNIIINSLSIDGDEFLKMSKEEYGIRESDLMKLLNLTEIYGYLEIHLGNHADWLKTLLYLKNLKIIRADAINSHTTYGLSIVGNDHLVVLGLQSLKEVRNGDIVIKRNTNLCFTRTLTIKSIIHKKSMNISNNGNRKKCMMSKCHKECQPGYGCWGPLPVFCVRCRNFSVPEEKLCTSNCSLAFGHFYNISSDTNLDKNCSKCHSECLPGFNTCYGPEANQCNLGCKNNMFKEHCVSVCPSRYYKDNTTKRQCHKCHSTCTERKIYSIEPVCTGSGDFLGRGGCIKCNNIILDLDLISNAPYNNNTLLMRCRHTNEICPRGYYKLIVDFKSKDQIWRINSIFSNITNIVERLENWVTIETHHELQIGSICLPCHPYCLECNEASNVHCQKCKYFKSDNNCVFNCGTDYYSEFNQKTETEAENLCQKCHNECIDGCMGPTEFECNKCRHVKIYTNDTKKTFFCNSTCGELVEIFKTSEIVCVESWTIGRLSVNQYIIGSLIILGFILAVIIVGGFIISSLRKKRELKMKTKYLKDFHINETESNSGVLPNMSTLLLITESQLTREEIIGSGAFGVVYKGIWQPTIDSIDKSSSFLRRNLSKLSQDTSIKLLVAVKILTDISDPANNRELLEEAKVMASVDHPCCLRILAVCLTAHPKLITQFMPLGCLLEFCQRHRSLIKNSTLLNWAKQIACGMEYLESKGIIHCDLAARNVLVQSPRQVKITDFGLAKMLDHSQQQYQFKGGRMPIKWLAIECIKSRLFSSKSDVWSYGVTLWEMFTFGEKPFPDIKAYDILEHLEKGQRLNQPKICSIDAYTILIQCWLVDPDSRPCFTELRKTFEMMSNNPNRYLLIQNTDFVEPLYVDWEDDAQIYDEFLQALVSVSQTSAEYESVIPKPAERKHIKSVKNRYRQMCAYKNSFVNNEIYETKTGEMEILNTVNPDYTTILFDERVYNNTSGSTWSDYMDMRKRTSTTTMTTNINSNCNYFLNCRLRRSDLTDDGYLIPKSNYIKELKCNMPQILKSDENPEKIIYSCERNVEKEVLINHESSI